MKGIKTAFIVFAGLIALLILLFSLPMLIDNIALGLYKADVLDNLSLPAETEIVEVVSGCGNTSGAGNHTELYVAILLKTTLPEEEWERSAYSAYIDRYVAWEGQETLAMSCVGVSFSEITADIDSDETYYIFECVKSAPCSFLDLRGH